MKIEEVITKDWNDQDDKSLTRGDGAFVSCDEDYERANYEKQYGKD